MSAAIGTQRANATAGKVLIVDDEATLDKSLDGRLARSARTRTNIVDSYLALLRTSEAVPTKADVVRLAGCCMRTLYHHFPTYVELNGAAVAQVRSGEPVFEPVTGDLHQRVRNYGKWCAASWEQWLPVRSLLALPGKRASKVKAILEQLHRRKADKLNLILAPEFSSLPRLRHCAAFFMIEAATSLDTWVRLRRIHRLSVEAGAALLVRTIMGISLYELGERSAPPRLPPIGHGPTVLVSSAEIEELGSQFPAVDTFAR